MNIKRLNQVHGNRNITVVEETRTSAKPFHAFEPTCSSLQRLVLLSRPPFSNLAPTETKSSGKTLLKSFPGDGFHHSERRPVLQPPCQPGMVHRGGTSDLRGDANVSVLARSPGGPGVFFVTTRPRSADVTRCGHTVVSAQVQLSTGTRCFSFTSAPKGHLINSSALICFVISQEAHKRLSLEFEPICVLIAILHSSQNVHMAQRASRRSQRGGGPFGDGRALPVLVAMVFCCRDKLSASD